MFSPKSIEPRGHPEAEWKSRWTSGPLTNDAFQDRLLVLLQPAEPTGCDLRISKDQ